MIRKFLIWWRWTQWKRRNGIEELGRSIPVNTPIYPGRKPLARAETCPSCGKRGMAHLWFMSKDGDLLTCKYCEEPWVV